MSVPVPAFTPRPFQIVDTPAQLKAFTDPLRERILALLAEREATNQQLAQALDQPQAKVLYHLRYLLECGLIQLVDTRIKGGNVEKYYRAVARMFGIRANRELFADVTAAQFDSLAQVVAASATLWPEPPDHPRWEGRTARLPPQRAAEFHQRLLALIAEYWGGPRQGTEPAAVSLPVEDPTAPLLAFAAVLYRDPTDRGTDVPASADPAGESSAD